MRHPWMQRRRAAVLCAFVLIQVLCVLPRVSSVEAATTLTPGFVSELVATTGALTPGAVAWAPDGRMFIGYKRGLVRMYQNGTLLDTPFIDISAEVNQNIDRGMLGIAVDPDFPTKPYVYLLYTYDPPGLTGVAGSGTMDAPDGRGQRVGRLIRVEADAAQGYNVAKANSTIVLLGTNSTLANTGDFTQEAGPSVPEACMQGSTPIKDCVASDGISHSTGTVMFGTDGSLFVSIGEASTGNAGDERPLRAQNLDSLNGKILRINPQTGAGYTDNPFYNGDPTSNRSKIWAYGLRNPFRLTVQPSTNEPFVGDVGQSSWEELNTGKGKNFGWPCYEGGTGGSLKQASFQTESLCVALYAQGTSAVQAPLYTYAHDGTDGAAIMGTFYSGASYPQEYRNAMFFADYSRDWIKYMTFDANGNGTVHDFATDLQQTGTGGPIHMAVGPDTNIYYVLYGGEIRRLRYVGGNNSAPIARANATPTSGRLPLAVTFSALGSADPDQTPESLVYTWDFGDGVLATGASTAHTYTTDGTYTAKLTVTDNGGLSDSMTVTITAGNTAPVPKITSPALGTTYNGGATVTFSGTATDAEDGTLADSQLEWTFVLHHGTHTHQDAFPTRTGVGSGSIIIPRDHGNNIAVEMCLKATDSQGLSSTTCQEYWPNTVTYTFATEPPGLQLVHDDGITSAAPFTATLIVEGDHVFVAPLVQQHLSFSHWQDSNTQPLRVLRGAATAQTYTAVYANRVPTATLALKGTPMLGTALSFDGSASTDPEDGTADLIYMWDFGDGTTAVGATAMHAYTQAGNFTVRLTVADRLGGTSSTTTSVNIAPNQGPEPPTQRLLWLPFALR